MKTELCGLGNALMDVLIRLDSDEPLHALGLQKGIVHLVDELEWQGIFEQLEALPHETHSGGSCANAVCTTALLGAETAFCGQVGQDRFGNAYASTLEALCGRHFLHRHASGHTGKCLSLITPDTERTMVTTLGCAIELEPQHLFRDIIPQSGFLHVTGYLFTGGRMADTAREALEHARAHNVRVSIDVSDPWVISGHHELMWELIDRYAHVVFTNAEEARALCHTSPEEALIKLSEHCEVAVVKLGSRGSLVRSNGHTYGIDVFPVKAVDSTGAGDAYAGGFLYGLVKGLDLEKCGRLASRVAAETVTQTGAVVTQPGRLRALATEF